MQLEHLIAWLIIILQVPISILTYKVLNQPKGKIKELNPFMKFLMGRIGIGKALVASLLITLFPVYMFTLFPEPFSHVIVSFILGFVSSTC